MRKFTSFTSELSKMNDFMEIFSNQGHDRVDAINVHYWGARATVIMSGPIESGE